MADLRMWGANIHLLLGLLLCLAAGAVALAALWTGLKIWIWRVLQRRAWQQYRRQNRRADGRPYPPFTGGVCDDCGRVSKKIYHPVSGPRLCSPCYETYWRQSELFSPRSQTAQPEETCPDRAGLAP